MQIKKKNPLATRKLTTPPVDTATTGPVGGLNIATMKLRNAKKGVSEAQKEGMVGEVSLGKTEVSPVREKMIERLKKRGK